MTVSAHTFTGRQHRTSYTTICEGIIDTWAKDQLELLFELLLKLPASLLHLNLERLNLNIVRNCSKFIAFKNASF